MGQAMSSSSPARLTIDLDALAHNFAVLRVAAPGADAAPVIKADGSFTDEDLCYDAPTVMQLSVQALMFNIGDFFQGAGLIQKPAK